MRDPSPAAEFAEPFFALCASDGLPPRDGALLLTHAHGEDGPIVLTLGPLVCGPMLAKKKLIDYLVRMETRADGDAM